MTAIDLGLYFQGGNLTCNAAIVVGNKTDLVRTRTVPIDSEYFFLHLCIYLIITFKMIMLLMFLCLPLSIKDNVATPFLHKKFIFGFSLGRSRYQSHLFKVSLKGFSQGPVRPCLFPFAWWIPS